MKRVSVLLTGMTMMALCATALGQGQYDDNDTVAALSFVVLKDYNGKPIRNASVVLHQVNKKGKQEKGDLELKADADGKCYFDGVPYGTLRVQVLAPGFQTFGQDYDIDRPKLTITVKMLRPQGQYSIYTDKQNDTDKQDDTKKDDTKKDDTAPANGSAKPKQ
jgi:hypothetical protein